MTDPAGVSRSLGAPVRSARLEDGREVRLRAFSREDEPEVRAFMVIRAGRQTVERLNGRVQRVEYLL